VPDSNFTVFSAGEIVSLDKRPWKARGIMISGPPVAPGTVGTVNLLTLPSAERAGGLPFDTLDRALLVDKPRGSYEYAVTSTASQADVKSLREASVVYPTWLTPYIKLYSGGRPIERPTRDREIEALTRKIVSDAGAKNPYDMAKAIESWFRDSGVFTYTLEPKIASGERALDSFLFITHTGYCQDFSTAMAVMLRTLQIPVRQMSGYGLGSYDDKTHRYSVNATDAHSWAEVYFPGYGWIPFEPTPDGQNAPVNRPLTRADVDTAGGAGAQASSRPKDEVSEPAFAEPSAGSTLNPWSQALWVALVLLVLMLLALLAMWQWLVGARDAPRIWRRLLFLADRLRVPRRPGDTPNELGARLASSLPELGSELRALATLHTRSRYRRGGLGPADQVELKRSWGRIRRSYPGLLVRAFRDNWRDRGVRTEAASRSGSRGRPGRR
jgi:transglutaminase-like putative cysteine protease